MRKISILLSLIITGCTSTTIVSPVNPSPTATTTSIPMYPSPTITSTIKPSETNEISYSNIKTKGMQYKFIWLVGFEHDGNYLSDTRTENYFPYHIDLEYFRNENIYEEFEANTFLKDGAIYKDIVWDSSDKSIFTIESGKLKAYKAGQADIIIKTRSNDKEILRSPIVIFGEKYIPKPTPDFAPGIVNTINYLITGKVTDEAGNPLDEVKISLNYSDFEKLNNQYKRRVPGNIQFTDKDGNYKFIAPDMDLYSLPFTASKKGYKSSTQIVNFNLSRKIDFVGKYSLEKE